MKKETEGDLTQRSENRFDEDNCGITESVDHLIERFGPRLAGTPGCLGAAVELEERFGKECDRSWLQKFHIHPDSFWCIPGVTAFGFLLATGLYVMNREMLALMILLAGFIYTLVHYIFLNGLFDRLFQQKEGLNVAGVIEPNGEVERQILLCAHHDSAKRCRFLEECQVLYPFRLIAAMMLYTLNTSAFILMVLPLPGVHAFLKEIMPFSLAVGVIFITPFFFFYRSEGTPGAGDNLLGSVILIRLAHLFGKNGKRLDTTRLILVSHDGEEIGMRGAHFFLREHRELLDSSPLTVINIDSLHHFDDLTLLETDRNGWVSLSGDLNRKLKKEWKRMGLDVKLKKLPLGGGGTDAAVYAAAGYETASLIGISTSLVRNGLVYHTRMDDVEHLDGSIIRAALRGLSRAICVLDKQIS